MFLKKAAKSLFLPLLTNILFAVHVFPQTTPLTFTSISINDPDLNAPGRGVEQWHDRNEVNVPIEGTNTQRLDIYFRFVWTRIEGPTLGSYTWNYFDSLVNYAITRKQKMSFGIMQLYPGGTVQNGLVSFDGGVASYPLYLHTLMQAETVKDWRTGTVWTPNYNSLNYQNRLLALHQAINAHLNTTSFNGVLYKNVISCIDIRGYGAWGEWHSGYTAKNVVSDYPAGTFPTVASLKKIVDAHTQGFPDFPLVAMIAAFDAIWLQNTMNPPEIAYYVLTQRNNWGLIGWRRDQWGATDPYIADYLENNTRTFGGLVFKDSIMVRWKSAPITGEPPGWNPNSFSDLERQIGLYHATSFGNGNYGTTPTSTIKTRVRAASKLCGYRLILEAGNLILNGNNLTVALNWKNIGQAPTYENWNVEFELKNSNNQTVWSGQSQFKPKRFLPSGTATIVTDNFTSLPAGTFKLSIIIKDPNGYRDPLPLAITGRNADGSYPIMQQITIQSSVPTPNVAVTNNCGSSVLTASGYTGTLLWSTGENTPSITVTAPGLYTVTQTVGGTTSAFGSATAAPKAIPSTPVVAVVNNCNSSVLSATGVTGTLLWSTGETTSSITVTTAGSYTVTQTVNGCTSPAGSGSASPKPIPALTSSLTATATSSSAFSYTATSSTSGTTFAWSRAAVTGISNAAANGNGNINETLVNTTVSSVNVTYVYTLTANGCTNTQNVVVAVGVDGSIATPAVTTQPSTQTRCAGVDAIFSSAASGSPAPTVQWQETTNGTSWHNITGATAGTLSFTTTTADNNNQYRAIWTNITGTATSNSATLTVNSIPAAPGVSVTDNCGSSLLTAIGAPGATFSWSTGATSNSITVPVGTYTVTQTVNSCTGPSASATAASKSIPSAPDVSVSDNCGSSLLTATGAPGATFSWSNGATTAAISVSINGTYTVNQTVNNCTSADGSGVAAPKAIPALTSSLAATATSSSAFSYTATSSTPGTTFAWSRAAVTGISNAAANGNGNINETLVNTTLSPVNVTYLYTLTVNGCTNTQNVVVTVGVDGSIVAPAVTTQPAAQTRCAGVNANFSSAASGSPAPTVQWQESTNGTTWNNITGATAGTLSFTTTTADNNKQYRAIWTNITGTATSNSATLTVNSIPAAPGVSVTDNCNSSLLTATGAPGATFSWSNGATTAAISVSTNGTYTVNQTVNNCTSAEGSGVAAPKPIPALSSSLTGTATSGSAFTYTATSGTPGTTFAWSRAVVTGISNVAANGNGNINETLVNTTASPVNVTYIYTLTANGCTNTQNVVVTVGVDGSIVAPAVTTQPATQTRCAGVSANFSSAASGSPAPTVQWQESTNGTIWNNIPGANAGTLSFTTTTADNNKQYRAVWTNITGTATSNSATLTVNSIPAAPGVSVTDNCGSSLLTATGAPGATFSWSNGATTSSITVTIPGTYTVTQTLNSCSSPAASGVAAPKPIPALSSSLTATATSSAVFTYTATSGTPGTTFAWSRATVTGISNAAVNGNGNINETLVNTTASPVDVIYAYTLTANGCTNTQNVVVTVGAGASIVAPVVTTQPASQTRCAGVNANFSSAASGSPVPTVQWQESTNGTTWNNVTGATASILSFATAAADNNKQYRAVWTNIGGTATSTSATLTVNTIPAAPGVSVTDNCGNSLLTATGEPTATFSWSTSATTSSITVTTPGTYTVTQTVNSCSSPASSGVAAPKPIPVLSSNLSATATTGAAFIYTATSTTGGTTFGWSRAAVTGISNTAATGTGNINETLVNTTTSPVNVTYVYTLTANGCSNNQNVIVTVNPVVNCVINGSIASTFNSTSIPAGRFIWFSSVIDKGNISGVTGTVTFNITNSRITFTANSQQYVLNVPNSRIRFDAAITSATTEFVNNVWETAVPRSYNGYVFMGGLNYQVLANLPGSISNVTWTATISIDKAGMKPTWKWAAAVYTSLGAYSALGIKPKNGNNQNPYPNNDNAGTPENYKSLVVSGAKGTGGTNYTGTYSSPSTATCSTSVGQRSAEPVSVTTEQLIVKDIPALHIELSEGEKLEATAVPNPTSTSFNLVINGNRKSPVSVKVIDISGRVVERYEKFPANHVIKVGQRLAAGSYFVEVIQDDQKKIIRVIKVN